MIRETFRLYIRVGDKYYRLLKARRCPIQHKGVWHDAIIFWWFPEALLSLFGVGEAHYTYPDNGEAHYTFAFKDGKKLHVSSERVNLSWPRSHNPETLPEARTLRAHAILMPHRDPPPFANLSSLDQLLLLIAVFHLPVRFSSLYRAVQTPKAGSVVFDATGLVGALSIYPFVTGTRDPDFMFDEFTPERSEIYARGASAPFWGAAVAHYLPGSTTSTAMSIVNGQPVSVIPGKPVSG